MSTAVRFVAHLNTQQSQGAGKKRGLRKCCYSLFGPLKYSAILTRPKKKSKNAKSEDGDKMKQPNLKKLKKRTEKEIAL